MNRLKTWEELDISDNFIFQKVMQDEKLCKTFIEKLLGIKIKSVKYPESEKVMEKSPMQKGIRLDLYVETDDGRIVDIEMQTTNKEGGFLPKRARYYQAMIDLNSLDKGDDYVKLNKSVVVFICTFDPFPHNRRKLYTFTNRCHEREGLELGDETVKIYLNTKGKIGKIDEDIDKFLAYVDGKVAEGNFTKYIANKVAKLKRHDETRLEYMTLMMEINEQRRDAYNIGRNEGRNEGRNDAKFEFAHSLVEKEGWSLDKTFDFLSFSPEDKVAFNKQLQ